MRRTEPSTSLLRGHAYTPSHKTDVRHTIERARAALIAERLRHSEPRREDGARVAGHRQEVQP